ncbi:hypothetical protein L1987_68956 [Smallanthus sonchifolius]|uniref:Uncharacterized protein n=1 Tax=Smallanthus sonchifolius TaxID=185202 RepID=A0ACB9B618_9ASTR|nr:hypothetical protein L1987_68956 [Smallanthus sonchifolius]
MWRLSASKPKMGTNHNMSREDSTQPLFRPAESVVPNGPAFMIAIGIARAPLLGSNSTFFVDSWGVDFSVGAWWLYAFGLISYGDIEDNECFSDLTSLRSVKVSSLVWKAIDEGSVVNVHLEMHVGVEKSRNRNFMSSKIIDDENSLSLSFNFPSLVLDYRYTVACLGSSYYTSKAGRGPTWVNAFLLVVERPWHFIGVGFSLTTLSSGVVVS